MSAARLNYHHLQYFWAVAHEGSLTGAARQLRVSQSALSTQIRQLEEQLGEALFAREGRSLRLTEAGQIALSYADDIFASGTELLATLQEGRGREQALRIGAVSTLSRNFQESFVRPLLDQPGVRLRLHSAGTGELLGMLEAHALDLVLSNRPVQREAGRAFRCRRIARQQVSLVGRPRAKPFRFPRDAHGASMLLPAPDSDVRAAFDALCQQRGIEVRVLAEVDDMAMMRLLARDSSAVALLPSVVVRDELSSGALAEYCVVPGLHESFYAVSVERRYQHPLLKSLLSRGEDEILAMGPPGEGLASAGAFGPGGIRSALAAVP